MYMASQLSQNLIENYDNLYSGMIYNITYIYIYIYIGGSDH